MESPAVHDAIIVPMSAPPSSRRSSAVIIIRVVIIRVVPLPLQQREQWRRTHDLSVRQHDLRIWAGCLQLLQQLQHQHRWHATATAVLVLVAVVRVGQQPLATGRRPAYRPRWLCMLRSECERQYRQRQPD